MTNFADKIIEIVGKAPGITDRVLTDMLKGRSSHPSQVNQEARLLERRGILKRARRQDGRIGNYMCDSDIPVTAPVSISVRNELPASKSKNVGRDIPRKAIFLLSCVKSKRNHSCSAKEMYVSPLFKKMLAVALKSQPKQIFILSAKYGLLKPDDVIKPYEMTLKTMSASERMAWSEKVLESLRDETDLTKDHFVFLAGQSYRQGLTPYLRHYAVPMEGLSFGQQLQWLNIHAP